MPALSFTAVIRRYDHDFPHNEPLGGEARVGDFRWRIGRRHSKTEIVQGRICRLCGRLAIDPCYRTAVPRDEEGEPQTCHSCARYLERRFARRTLPEKPKGGTFTKWWDNVYLYALCRLYLHELDKARKAGRI